MALFDAPDFGKHPRRWADYSFDYKLSFVWMGGLFALLILSDSKIVAQLDPVIVPAIVFMAGAILLGLSLDNRRRQGWRWPPLDSASILKATGIALVMAIFFFVFLQGVGSASLPLPMALFAISIGMLNVLTALKLIQPSQKEFEVYCGTQQIVAELEKPLDPHWKRVIRGIYSAAFLAVWLEGLGFFYFHQQAIQSGSAHPTSTHTAIISEHGSLIYVTEEQKRLDNLLSTIMMIGIPAAIVGGFLLHFVAGVALFGNIPPSGGIFSSRK